MNINHVKAIVLRNIYLWFRDVDRLFDAFWWSFFDIAIWGLMSAYFARVFNQENILTTTMMGIIFWSVLTRSQWELSATMITESWDRNLINIFVSPITTFEFLLAACFLSLVKLVLVIVFMAIVVWFMFALNILVVKWWIVPFLASLFLTSIWLAFFINALVLRLGKNAISFSWTLVFIINPLSGIFYPLSALPPVFQQIAKLLPSSYVFEGMRTVLAKGSLDISVLLISFGLNFIYLGGSIIYYHYTLKKAREKGWLIKLA